ncbi:MAG TPA: CBS domain-containing protein [Blastocatellia bacterium]|nr:CBS domain-containing protein [Blastocatellia bacterium]
MAYRDRGYGSYREGTDLDEGRYDTEPRRPYTGRFSGRGYGEDYRGYSRGYNVSREPNYRTERDEGYTGYGRAYDDTYGRAPVQQGWWPSSEAERWETRDRQMYGRGPARSHLRCRDIMSRNVVTCRRDAPIFGVASIMRDHDIGAVPVVDEAGKLEGIVTDRDIVVTGLASDKTDAELRAEDCMSTDLYTANQNDRVVDVIREMGDHQVRRVPVVDSRNRLVGIISMADIALQTDKDDELADALEEISEPSSVFGRIARWFS